MNHLPLGRAFYNFAAFGALLAASGTISLVAWGRQSPPSPSQAKKAVPPAATGKQIPLPGFSNPTSAANPPEGAPKNSSGDLVMDVSDLSAKTGIAKGKNVIYTEGNMKFTALTAVYNDTTKQLDAQGNLELDAPKHHLTGDKAHVDRKKQQAVITGGVIITLKPTPPDPNIPANPDTAKQRQYPVIITCDRAEDSYKKDFIILTGHLIFKQNILKDNGRMVERTMTSEHAEYDGKANKLHLFRPVKANDTEGQTIDFEKDAFVGTKEGDETLTTPGKATVHFNLDDATKEDPVAEKTSDDKQIGEKKQPEKSDTPPVKKPN